MKEIGFSGQGKMSFKVLFLTLIFCVFSQISSAQKYDVKTWWRLGAENVREKDINSRGDDTYFRGNLTFTRFIQDWSKIVFQPGFKFATGNGQGVIHDRRARNSLYINQAIFQTTHDIFQVTAGAISQSHLYARDVVNPFISFPGMMGELFFFKNAKTKLSGRGQIAVPSAYTFGSNSTQVESTPRLYTATAEFAHEFWNDSDYRFVATYFSYQQLPQVIAVDSATQGNSVNLTSTTTGQFIYNFEGFTLHQRMELEFFGPIAFVSQLAFAKNNSAVTGRNEAKTAWTGLRFDYNSENRFYLLGLYSRRESDVGPAELAYGTSFNNRLTYGARLYYELPKEKLKFVAGYEEADPIYKTAIQGNRKLFFIRVEGHDDIF